MSDLRRNFAREIAEISGVDDPRIEAAFAAVPREAFLGDGPWLTIPDDSGYGSTPDADPAHIYQDVAVAIDAARMLNNGSPGLLAAWIAALQLGEGETVAHLGCATGYYSAILAEVVGPRGRVISVELDPELYERARRSLKPWRQVEVRQTDALEEPREQVDAILVHAGVTHPAPGWLASVGIGGRIAMAITAIRPPSRIRRIVRNHAGRVLVLRREALGWSARFIVRVGVQAMLGGRDRELQRVLEKAMTGPDPAGASVRSLRLDAHEPTESCWAHGEGYCLSTSSEGEIS
jgi:protein-L-isoaspartate(D-aspartate) O-methyltransferase